MYTQGVLVTREQLDDLARSLVAELSADDRPAFLALTGPLGSGKTTFVQALAGVIGVAEHVASPTFTLMRTYAAAHPRFKKLVHIDCYRVEDPRELAILDLAGYSRERSALVCVEWPERAGSLPAQARTIRFEVAGENTRTITFNEHNG